MIVILAMAAVLMITAGIEAWMCQLCEQGNWTGMGINTILIVALIVWIMKLKGVF